MTLSALGSPAPKLGQFLGTQGVQVRTPVDQESLTYRSLKGCKFNCRIAPPDQDVFNGRDRRFHSRTAKNLASQVRALERTHEPDIGKTA
jgi:hypothetical protein